MRHPSSFLLLVLLVLATACGGGGGSSGGEPGAGSWLIHGYVACEGDPGGVRVVLDGDVEASTTSDASGYFRFAGVPNGSYRVMPVSGGCDFAPDYYDLLIAGQQPHPVEFEREPLTNAQAPEDPVRLVMIHQETGAALLDTHQGNLGANLAHQNYFVRNVTRGWDAPQNPDIGDRTDVGAYWTWFADPTVQANGVATRDNILQALYTTNAKTGTWPSDLADPGGENEILLILSPSASNALRDANGTTPEDLQGQPHTEPAHTLVNCKAIYAELLVAFKAHPHKMFVILTAPPLADGMTTETEAGNARALSDWLVQAWLQEADWLNRNVYVWDLYNVLTAPTNHHRYHLGAVEHEQAASWNTAAYATSATDSTPNPEGSFKVTSELLGVLNVSYHRWHHWFTTP